MQPNPLYHPYATTTTTATHQHHQCPHPYPANNLYLSENHNYHHQLQINSNVGHNLERREFSGGGFNYVRHGTMDPEVYFNSTPPGFLFCPSDVELIVDYLKYKIENSSLLPINRIHEVKLYESSPDKLTADERHKLVREREWYFFTSRDRKYKNGSRPNRAIGNGYWKPIGKYKPIKHKGQLVGHKRALDYYEGHHPEGNRTEWKMHEYLVPSSNSNATDLPSTSSSNMESHDMQLDKWVLCKIYKNTRGDRGGSATGNSDPQSTEQPNDNVAPENYTNMASTSASTESLHHYTYDDTITGACQNTLESFDRFNDIDLGYFDIDEYFTDKVSGTEVQHSSIVLPLAEPSSSELPNPAQGQTGNCPPEIPRDKS